MTSMGADSDLTAWTTLNSRRVFANRWLAVHLDKVALPDGRQYEYTRLQPGGIGVGVIGFNDAGEVLLEREYRHGVGESIWQIPGGLGDGHESLRATGLRELLEETGYAPREVNSETVRYLGSVWDNPALGPSESHIYAVWGLEEAAEPRRDMPEYLTLHWVTMEWLKDAIRSDEIRDRVVIAAVAQLMLHGWA